MRTVLETPRLRLRELARDDLDFMAAMLGDPEVMRFYPKCYDRAEAAGWIDRQRERYARDGYGRWLAVSRAAGLPVGLVGLADMEVDGVAEPEVGYILHRPYWRQGLATEAAAATRDHAFTVLGKRHVIALVRPENVPSQGVARKIGMAPGRRTLHAGLEHIVFAVRRLGGMRDEG